MSDKAELHLIVPGICGPVADTLPLNESPVMKRWLKKLSRSNCADIDGSAEQILASLLKFDIEGDLPSAILQLITHRLYDDTKYYMHADPVHLMADLDHAILTSSADLAIGEVESSALCESLNAHFEADGLRLVRLDKDRWIISSENPIELSTTALKDAVGRNINFLLPQGSDAVYWKQVLTEAQMLMFSHDSNVQREQKGEAVINSLWFHGSGSLPDKTANALSADYVLCTDNDTARGMADYTGCLHYELPEDARAYIDGLLATGQGSVNILQRGDLEHLLNYTDVRHWLQALDGLLENWIYPLLAVAARKGIDLYLYPCNGKRYQFSKYDGLKFWRRPLLENYVSRYQGKANHG